MTPSRDRFLKRAGWPPVAHPTSLPKDELMPTKWTPRLWFEVDAERDPIAGQMHAIGEPPRSFDSWLELVALIEQTRARRSHPATHSKGT